MFTQKSWPDNRLDEEQNKEMGPYTPLHLARAPSLAKQQAQIKEA